MRLPDFPRPLARLLAALPPYPASLAFAAGSRILAWPALRGLDWSPVLGRRFCLYVRDLGVRVYFSLHEDGFRAESSGPVDVTFTATAADLARLALRLEDPDTLFFNRRLLIEGDTNVGLTVKNLLDTVELESVLGAMPAGLGSAVINLRQLALR